MIRFNAKHSFTLAAALALGMTAAWSQSAQAGTVFAGSVDNGTLAFTPKGSAPERGVINSPNESSISNFGVTTDGTFNFDPNLGGAPGYGSSHPFQVGQNQFRFEMDYDFTGSNPHTFHPVDYDGSGSQTNGGVENTSENVVWAITGNDGNRTNSILRGSTTDLTVSPLDGSLPIHISGKLYTDGKVHWYGDTDNDGNYLDDDTTTLSSLGLEDYLLIDGLITNRDTSGSGDYGTETFNLDASFVTTVPTPSAALAGMAMMGLMSFRRRRRRMA